MPNDTRGPEKKSVKSPKKTFTQLEASNGKRARRGKKQWSMVGKNWDAQGVKRVDIKTDSVWTSKFGGRN